MKSFLIQLMSLDGKGFVQTPCSFGDTIDWTKGLEIKLRQTLLEFEYMYSGCKTVKEYHVWKKEQKNALKNYMKEWNRNRSKNNQIVKGRLVTRNGKLKIDRRYKIKIVSTPFLDRVLKNKKTECLHEWKNVK